MTDLAIITTLFNPAQYRSRYRLYQAFRERVAGAGGRLVTVELAFRDQPFVVTERDNPLHVQLRSDSAIWYKENLVNIAVRRLPPTCTRVAWLDADIAFARPDWPQATVRALDAHPFVQMFTHVLDLGPNDEPLKSSEGFAHKLRRDPAAAARRDYGQPGYAWAARRDAFEAVGGLIDWSILGSNDYYMAQAMIGALEPQSTRMPGSNYANMLLGWQHRFRTAVDGEIGFVATTLLHYWHGRRADRGYDTRWRILADNGFDPATDLRTDADGLLALTDAKPRLRDAIQAYFAARNEDGTER